MPSQKALHRLQKQEEKISRKLYSKDSALANAKLAEIKEKDAEREKLKNPTISNNQTEYISKMDTLSTALRFLDQNGDVVNVKQALNKISSFRDLLKQSDELKKFIQERRKQLKTELEKLGIVKELKKFNKEVLLFRTD